MQKILEYKSPKVDIQAVDFPTLCLHKNASMLLHQLKQLVAACNQHGLTWGRLIICEEVIAKAEGKS